MRACLGADLCLLSLRCRGLPGGKSLFFASPKKSNQKKGDPQSASPALRYGAPCGAQSSRGLVQTRLRLRQARALIRLALRSSAQPEGVRELNSQYRTPQVRAKRVLVPRVRIHFSHPVLAGPSSADGGGRSGQTCLSRRRVVWTAAGVEQRRLPVTQ